MKTTYKTLSLGLLVLTSTCSAAQRPTAESCAYETASGAGREWAKNTKLANDLDKTCSNQYLRLLFNKESIVEMTYAAARILLAEMTSKSSVSKKDAEQAAIKMAEVGIREVAINIAHKGFHSVDASKLKSRIRGAVGERVYEVAELAGKYTVKHFVDYGVASGIDALRDLRTKKSDK